MSLELEVTLTMWNYALKKQIKPNQITLKHGQYSESRVRTWHTNTARKNSFTVKDLEVFRVQELNVILCC